MDNKQDIANNELDDFFSTGEEVDISNLGNITEPKVLPSYTKEDIKKFSETLESDKLAKADKSLRINTHMITNNDDIIEPDDIGYRSNIKQLVNELEHNGIVFSTKAKELNKRAKTGKTALLKLKAKTGLGTPQPLPLYHSGFWVTINPLEKDEIVALEFDIIDKLNTVGKTIGVLAYSHKEVLFAEVILKVFEKQLLTSSLKIEDGEYSVKDFIHINDIPIVAWYIAKTMYPNGFNALIPCKESLTLDNGIPKCSNILKMKIDMSELYYVDKNKLTLEHLNQMAKKQSNSVTMEEVVKYQDTLPMSGLVSKNYTLEDGSEITVNIKSTDASTYINYGQNFLDLLDMKTDEVIKNKEELDADTIKLTMLKLNELATYNHYIDSIPIDDTSITEPSEINDALKTLSNDLNVKDKIFKDIKEYISDSVIAGIGIPSYTCSNCNTEQTTQEYIPISVYNYFFTLLHLKYTKISNQLQKMM